MTALRFFYRPFIGLLLAGVLLTSLFPIPPQSVHSQAPAAQKIEAEDGRVVQTGTWVLQATHDASGGSYLYNEGEATLALNFAGPSLEVIYVAGPSLGTLAIEVDGTVLRTVITTAEETAYGQVAKIDYLTDEAHELKVYAQGGGTIAVDAFVAASFVYQEAPATTQLVAATDTTSSMPCTPNSRVFDAITDPFGGVFALSDNGRYLVYASSGLYPIIYHYDRENCVTTAAYQVSISAFMHSMQVSDDGLQIVYTTLYTNPGPPCQIAYGVYWLDLRVVGAPVTGTLPGGFSGMGCIPPDVGGLSGNGQWYVYGDLTLRDTSTGVEQNVYAPDGSAVDVGSRLWPSHDGRYVAFGSYDADLVANDTNTSSDVFVYDRSANTFSRVSVATGGGQLNAESGVEDISPDGRFVLFYSSATNAVAGDTNGATDLFVYDRQTNTTRRVSVGGGGSQSSVTNYQGALSGDGQFVAFPSTDSSLVPNDTNGQEDVFLHDLQANTTTLVSSVMGASANGYSNRPQISHDGGLVAFSSYASNLVPGVAGNIDHGPNIFIASLAPMPPASDRLALASTYDLALYTNMFDSPASDNYFSYHASATPPGQWVMGDWDGDGWDTPGYYRGYGVFYYINSYMVSSVVTLFWSAVWIGVQDRPAVVGRFDATVAHDCIGVVDNANFPPYGTAFALYYTCDLTDLSAPALSLQWLSVLLPDAGGFSGTHQFAAGDFNNDGVDSVAVRRGEFISFTNVPPTTLLSEFNLAQYWGTPPSTGAAYGVFLTGDFDGAAGDSFGVYYYPPHFYYRNSIAWNPGGYLHQRVDPPLNVVNATSWR